MAGSTLKARDPQGSAPRPSHTRYEDDFYTWVSEQVALLRAGRLEEIDVENVAEELSDVGGAQYDKLESALEVLLMHMLKWDHQPQRRSRGWALTVDEQRARIEIQLRRNPGLKSRIAEAMVDGYRLGATRAAREMEIARKTLPATCPYDWAEITIRPFDWDEAS